MLGSVGDGKGWWTGTAVLLLALLAIASFRSPAAPSAAAPNALPVGAHGARVEPERVRVSHTRAAAAWLSPRQTVRAEPEREAAAATPASGAALLSGRVLDAAGGSVAEASIRVRALGASEELLTARSDAEGRFRLASAPGWVEVRAQADGYSQDAMVLLAPRAGVDLVLAPAADIVGRVITEDSGQPVAAVAVSAVGRSSVQSEPRVVTSSEDGSFHLENLPHGGYELTAASPAFRSRPIWVQLGAAQTSDLVLVPVAAASELTGQVLVAGAPCTDGMLVLSGAGAGSASTAADGSLRIEGLLPGSYVADVYCSGALAAREPLAIGAQPVTHTWNLERGLSLRGRVESASGQPLPGARIIASPVLPEGTTASCSSNERGEFECGGLMAGEYECALFEPRGESVHVTLAAGATPPPLILRAAALAAIRVSSTSAGEPRLVPWRVFASAAGQTAADFVARARDAGWLFERLPLGRYQIHTGDADDPGASVLLERDGQVADVTLAPPLLDTMRGKVVDAGGTAVVDAWVSAVASDAQGTSRAGSVLTDETGAFTLVDLPRARYQLRVSSELGEASLDAVDSRVGAVLVRLPAFGRIAGTASTPSGAPLTNFELTWQQGEGPSVTSYERGGAWSLPWLAPGRYTLTLRSPQGSSTRHVELSPAASLQLSLVVQGAGSDP